MASDNSPLRRAELRSEVTQYEVHGIASRNQGREQGPFILWDISDKGLRLWLPQKIQSGEVLKLTIAKPFVVMMTAEVRWCKPTENDSGFQVGVRILDNLPRLEALHKKLSEEREAREREAEDDDLKVAAP